MTVNEYKEFIKNRYDEEPSESMIKRFCEINDIPYGMAINERMVAKTCENHGLSYTAPDRVTDDNLNDWWELTA
jgi:hypothetical protein